MKKKAEFLKECLWTLKEGIKTEVEFNIPLDENAKSWRSEDGILLSVREARALVEALESLQWANIYEGDNMNKIGREFLDFETADYMGRLAEGFDYIETVGIIRLKDD